MFSNKMAVLDTLQVDGYSQCFTCGFGIDCAAGTVVNRHGFLDEIKEKHLPPKFKEQSQKKLEAYKIAKSLGTILRNRRGR